jgi:HEAT repeat protein
MWREKREPSAFMGWTERLAPALYTANEIRWRTESGGGMTMERSVKRLMEDREKRREENIGKYIEQLSDESTPYRLRAAEALCGCGDERAVEPLIAALSDRENEVRWVAAQGLGKLHDPRAVEPLLPLLADSHRWVRRGAAWSLGELGDVRAVEPLIALLSDGKKDVRAVAAEALGKLRDRRAAEPLSAMLEDEDEPEVRTAIRRALREITGEAGV